MSLESLESVALPLELDEFDEIIDVRTPLEFEVDHLPGALNLPVLDNEQRVEVGTLYRTAPFQARRLGAAYISAAIARFLEGELAGRAHDWSPLLYCWRGGLRSRSLATVLRSVGWRARVLEGGYKSWRRFVMVDLARLLDRSRLPLHVIAGLTGTGKTRLLEALRNAGAQVLDLEDLANHRGSLLGSLGDQPSQKRFESRLHATLVAFDPARPVFCEAESNRIGSVYLPSPLWARLGEARVVELTLPLSDRVTLLLEDYDHFPRAPDSLAALLDRLRPLRGHAQVDSWLAQVAEAAWPEFVSSILKHHYDLCYRRPGSPEAVYQAPSERLEIPDASPESFRAAAAQLLTASASAPMS